MRTASRVVTPAPDEFWPCEPAPTTHRRLAADQPRLGVVLGSDGRYLVVQLNAAGHVPTHPVIVATCGSLAFARRVAFLPDAAEILRRTAFALDTYAPGRGTAEHARLAADALGG